MNLNQNYFELFGLPIEFRIDTDLLNDRYLGLQKEVHPDNFAAGTDQEKRLSMQWATFINTANATLKSPLARAIYLLELHDVKMENNPELPPDFLMQQIELREQLESIEDADGNLEKLDDFKQEARLVMSKIETNFAVAIGEDLAMAEKAVYELQFMSKLLVSADHLEEKLLDY